MQNRTPSFVRATLTNVFYILKAPTPKKVNNIKIILVDDNKERRIVTGDRLTAMGYIVLAAAKLSTLERCYDLYKDATLLASPYGDAQGIIDDLNNLSHLRNGGWDLQPFNLNTTTCND